jgi:hypothetical protein
VNSVGQANFDWIVNSVAELAVRKAKEHTGKPAEYRWSAFLNGGFADDEKLAKPLPNKKNLDGPPSKSGSDAAPESSKPGTMLEAASKQLRKRATKG